jgi:hypothetical protein
MKTSSRLSNCCSPRAFFQRALSLRLPSLAALGLAAVLITGCGESEPPEITEDVAEQIQAEDEQVADAESEL